MARKQGTITIEKPFGGWSPTISGAASSTPSASVEGKTNQYAYSKAISLFRLEKLGHIAPGEVMSQITDSSTRINQLPLNGAVASANGFSYFVLKNGRLVQTNNSGISTTNHDDISPAAPNHGGHSVSTTHNGDMLILKDAQATPVEYVIWSWEDGTDADVALMNTDRTGLDHDWFSTLSGGAVLRRNVPLKMCQGPTGDVYGTNGQYLFSVVMSAGTALTAATASTQALNLGAGWVGSGITVYKDFVATCGHKEVTSTSSITRSSVRVWLWRTVAGEFPFVYDIPDNFANGIFFDGVDLKVITQGRNNTMKIWKFTGSGFVLDFESPFIAMNGLTIQGGLELYQDSMHFVGDTNRVYQWYGGLHNRMVLSDGTNEAVAVGMLKNLYQGQLFAGVEISGSAYRVFYQDQFTEYYANTSDFRTRLYSLPYRSTITEVRLYFSQFGAGASFQASLFKNYTEISVGTTGTDMLAGRGTFTNAANGAINEAKIKVSIPDVSSFYMNFRFGHASVTNTAAILRKAEVDYITNE